MLLLAALFLMGDLHMKEIVTVDSLESAVLRKKAELIQEDELPLAKEIAGQLYLSLEPHFPAAGLAAPQIGINKAVFIYSFDRNPEHFEMVINPVLTPVGEEKAEGWEGCFSTMLCKTDLKVALVSRYEKIQVSYLDAEGKRVEKVLDGFEAKVFQHEYDHLQGIVNIDRKEASVKSFESKEELSSFMQQVKERDSHRYKKPIS